MRRERNKDSESQNPQKSKEGKKHEHPKDVSGKNQYVKEPPKWDAAQIKSFKEKDIEILNYLDSIGEGIYDEGRYPGMYLKKHNGELSDRVKKQLNTHARRNVDQEEPENSEELLRELFGNLKESTES